MYVTETLPVEGHVLQYVHYAKNIKRLEISISIKLCENIANRESKICSNRGLLQSLVSITHENPFHKI